MNIYTKGGDKGTTSLVHTKNVSKSDDRIQLVGTIDELTSHLGLVKTMLKDEDTIQFLEKIQRTLITVMAGVQILTRETTGLTTLKQNIWKTRSTGWKAFFRDRRNLSCRANVVCLLKWM